MTITRVPFSQGQNREDGVNAAYRAFREFAEQYAWEIAPNDPPPTREQMRDGFGEIWDVVELAVGSIRGAITGPLKDSDDEQLRVMIILVVLQKLNQYWGQLPQGVLHGNS